MAVGCDGASHIALEDGKIIMRNRELVGLDEEKIIRDAGQHMEKIIRKLGM